MFPVQISVIKAWQRQAGRYKVKSIALRSPERSSVKSGYCTPESSSVKSCYCTTERKYK